MFCFIFLSNNEVHVAIILYGRPYVFQCAPNTLVEFQIEISRPCPSPVSRESQSMVFAHRLTGAGGQHGPTGAIRGQQAYKMDLVGKTPTGGHQQVPRVTYSFCNAEGNDDDDQSPSCSSFLLFCYLQSPQALTVEWLDPRHFEGKMTSYLAQNTRRRAQDFWI